MLLNDLIDLNLSKTQIDLILIAVVKEIKAKKEESEIYYETNERKYIEIEEEIKEYIKIRNYLKFIQSEEY